MDLRTVVDPLYDLPAADFVAARNDLAKAVRAEGERKLAAEVAKLRRPTATAWALNQIARGQAEVLDAALAAKAELRRSTEGTGEVDVRTATTADREATRAVVVAARGHLGVEDAGLASRISSTLLAAVLDDGVAEVLRAGHLSAEQDASAFSLASDDLAPVIVLADRAPKKAPRPDAAAREAADAERARKKERIERERRVQVLESRVARLEAKAEEAEQVATMARAEADAAVVELDEAREALED